MSSNPFADLSKSLADYCNAMDSALDTDWTDDSPAARESEHEELADEWAERPARDAVIGARTLTTSAINHLRALSQLLVADGIIYPLFTVARGALEVSAQAHYLAEPDIGPRERVRRHMNMRLASLHEQKLLIEGLVDSPTGRQETLEALDHVEGRTAKILRSAKNQGFGRVKGKGYTPPHIGETPPSSMKVIEDAVSQNVPRLGTVFWRYLSAIAHGTEYGLAAYLKMVGPSDDPRRGDGVGTVQIDQRQAARNLIGGPLGAVSMMTRLLTLIGVDPEVIRPDVEMMMRVWGRVADIPFPDPTAVVDEAKAGHHSPT